MESIRAANVKELKIKKSFAFSSLDIFFNQVCLHTELKIELKTMQYNYKLSPRAAFTTHSVAALKMKSSTHVIPLKAYI